MPFKDALKKLKYQQEYNKKYYLKNKKRLAVYRKSRITQNREAWRRWYLKKQEQLRKKKIQEGIVYSERKFNPYAS